MNTVDKVNIEQQQGQGVQVERVQESVDFISPPAHTAVQFLSLSLFLLTRASDEICHEPSIRAISTTLFYWSHLEVSNAIINSATTTTFSSFCQETLASSSSLKLRIIISQLKHSIHIFCCFYCATRNAVTFNGF
jgi:hypothetical protein